MLLRLCNFLAALAFLAILAGSPTQAFAHSGHQVASEQVLNKDIQAKAVAPVPGKAQILSAYEPQPETSGCLTGTCSCCCIGCSASCHGHGSAIAAASFADFSRVSGKLVRLKIPASVPQLAPSSNDQPPKSFA